MRKQIAITLIRPKRTFFMENYNLIMDYSKYSLFVEESVLFLGGEVIGFIPSSQDRIIQATIEEEKIEELNKIRYIYEIKILEEEGR